MLGNISKPVTPQTKMPAEAHVVVVLPAYNAARTLVRTYRDIPKDVVDDVILSVDCSGALWSEQHHEGLGTSGLLWP